MQPVRFDVGLFRSIVYDFCLWDCVEGMGVHHEVTDAFTEVADLNPYVPKELISGPSPNYHDRLQIYLCQ